MTRRVPPVPAEGLMRPTEVADLLGVRPRDVWRWRETGVLVPRMQTAGGHARYRRADVEVVRAALAGASRT